MVNQDKQKQIQVQDQPKLNVDTKVKPLFTFSYHTLIAFAAVKIPAVT